MSDGDLIAIVNPDDAVTIEERRLGWVVPSRTAALPLETSLNRALTWGIGLLLGVLTLTTEYVGTPTDLFARVAPVDFICIALLGVLFFRHKMKPPPVAAIAFVGAIFLSMVPGLLFTPGEERNVWTSAAALLMAFGFYMAGLNIGSSRELVRGLVAGLCVGVAFQSVIVVHDLLLPNQWFPDPMEGRVRGTFKANGQLGAYGFCAAGLLITFGSSLRTRLFRAVSAWLGIIAACFVFVASRRTGMISVFIWGLLFLVLGWRFSGRNSYRAFLACYVAVLISIVALWPVIEESFVGRRFLSAVSSMGQDEGFIQNQFKACVQSAGQWFPFGFGVGRGDHIDRSDGHEIHNQHLALTVELGVLGIAGWLGMILAPLFRRSWLRRSREHHFLGVLMTAFLLISVLFMFHNTLARDRTYLLYLGIATTIVLQESRRHLPSSYFEGPAEPKGAV